MWFKKKKNKLELLLSKLIDKGINVNIHITGDLNVNGAESKQTSDIHIITNKQNKSKSNEELCIPDFKNTKQPENAFGQEE